MVAVVGVLKNNKSCLSGHVGTIKYIKLRSYLIEAYALRGFVNFSKPPPLLPTTTANSPLLKFLVHHLVYSVLKAFHAVPPLHLIGLLFITSINFTSTPNLPLIQTLHSHDGTKLIFNNSLRLKGRQT